MKLPTITTLKWVHKTKPPELGLFKTDGMLYNLRGAGRHEIALPL